MTLETSCRLSELGEPLFLSAIFHWDNDLFVSLCRQMQFVGIRSLPIIILTGLYRMVLPQRAMPRLFNGSQGSTVGLASTREIAPVFTALMVVAVVVPMAASIGTMKVTEQVDALTTMAVNPIHYLVVPRRGVCCYDATPGWFLLGWVLWCFVVATGLLNIDPNALCKVDLLCRYG
jgi:phospholipid/cholesterol/gamma-HCH transport system permease protein